MSATESTSDDFQQADINFENIFYSVSVPKQKGELIGVIHVL